MPVPGSASMWKLDATLGSEWSVAMRGLIVTSVAPASQYTSQWVHASLGAEVGLSYCCHPWMDT